MLEASGAGDLVDRVPYAEVERAAAGDPSRDRGLVRAGRPGTSRLGQSLGVAGPAAFGRQLARSHELGDLAEVGQVVVDVRLVTG